MSGILSARYAVCCGLAFAALTLPQAGDAKGYKQLYAFQGAANGGSPYDQLLLKGRDLYGTTAFGGANGFGTVFKLARDGTETILYSFQGIGVGDGKEPAGSLVADKSGDLFGATNAGGTGTCFGNTGCGTIFELAADGTETVLYAFQGGNDGSAPNESIIRDKKGNLFGTAIAGGGTSCAISGDPPGCGTVFKVTPDGKETTLYAFQGGSGDGAGPLGNLVADSSGNLYGSTGWGGDGSCTYVSAGCGIMFKIAPDGTETVLHVFQGGTADGSSPEGAPIFDKSGNMYGETFGGGNTGCGERCGTIFKLAPNGTETVLYSFCSQAKCGDGATPVFNTLVRDAKGNLYGTTSGGGADGHGVVFKLAPDGTETVLHSFAGNGDGMRPEGGLVADKSGSLYGETYGGGEDYGTVFKIKE
ncbi:MAG: choice-of-anchor tandem repeat GloVer-containing protein [Rhizomicrobium sp.]